MWAMMLIGKGLGKGPRLLKRDGHHVWAARTWAEDP